MTPCVLARLLSWLGAVTPIHWEKSCCEDTHMLIPSIKCPDSYFNSQILEKPASSALRYALWVCESSS